MSKLFPLRFKTAELRQELEEEAKTKGYTSLTEYINYLLSNRNNYAKADDDQFEAIRKLEIEKEKYIKEIAALKAGNNNNSSAPLVTHYAKRAWEIARIPEEKLKQGFN